MRSFFETKFIGVDIFSHLVFLNQSNAKIILAGVAVILFLFLLKLTYLGFFMGVVTIIWSSVLLINEHNKQEENFNKRYYGKNIRYLDKYAVFKAGMFRVKESNLYAESQKKGRLVLTDDVLNFEIKPHDNILSIPVASITKVEPTKRLSGMNPERPMLKIEFEDSNGKNDVIALRVKELARWVKAISAAKKMHA